MKLTQTLDLTQRCPHDTGGRYIAETIQIDDHIIAQRGESIGSQAVEPFDLVFSAVLAGEGHAERANEPELSEAVYHQLCIGYGAHHPLQTGASLAEHG